MADASTPAVELANADEVVEGVVVTWLDPDGTPVTGVVVNVDGLGDTPPTVSVAPDADPSNPIDVPLDQAEVVPAVVPSGATASVAPVDAIVGLSVSWMDVDGNEAEGTISAIDGLSATPPTVTVIPDSDPTTVVELPIDSLTSQDLEDAGDGGADDPISDSEDPAVDTAGPEEDQPQFDVVDGHPDCSSDPGGPVAVIIYEGGDTSGSGSVDSCWPDTDAAQVHIEELLAASAADAAPDAAMPLFSTDAVDEASDPTIFVGEVALEADRSGLSSLEHAAALAQQVRETLDLLHSIKPEIDADTSSKFGLATPVAGEVFHVEAAVTPDSSPIEILDAVHDEREAAVVASEVKALSLADMSDEEIIAEIARRYATDLVDGLTATDEVQEVEAPVEVFASDDEVDAVVEAADVPTEAAPVVASADYDWEGVLIVEGLPSGDGRQIGEGALTWRDLPLPLMLQTVNADGHDGAIICGSIQEIAREGQNILGFGKFDSGAAGQEAARLLTEGTMRGVSADIDSVVVEFLSAGGDVVSIEDVMMNGVEALEVLVEGRVMGATLCPFPAFQEAHVNVIESGAPDVAMVASGVEYQGDVWRVTSPVGAWPAGGKRPAAVVASAALDALVASAAAHDLVEVPVNPPSEWFAMGEMEQPMPFTVFPDGRCYGLVAQFGSCHIGFSDRCVDVPRTASAYKHFRNKSVKTEEGSLVATGPIFMDTVHPNLRLLASDAQAHYADTGCAIADVALYENEFGIVAAGALRPGKTEAEVRRFRGSDVSPDWRKIAGNLEVVGLLSVNVSGFVVESMVASGAEVTSARGRYDSVAGEVTALVAAGMVHHEEFAASEAEETQFALASLTDEVTEMRSALEELVFAPARQEKLAAARLALGLKDPAEVRQSKAAGLLASMGIQGAAGGSEALAVDCGCGGHENACECEV